MEDLYQAQEKFYFPTTKIDFAKYRSYYGLIAPDPDDEYYDFIKDLPSFEQSDLINSGTVQRLIYNLTYHYRSKARAIAATGEEDNALDVKAIELVMAENNNTLLTDYVIHDLYLKSLSDHNLAVYECDQ